MILARSFVLEDVSYLRAADGGNSSKQRCPACSAVSLLKCILFRIMLSKVGASAVCFVIECRRPILFNVARSKISIHKIKLILYLIIWMILIK